MAAGFELIPIPTVRLQSLDLDVLHCPDFIPPFRRSCPAVITVHDVAFRIAPRLNASGRIDHAFRHLHQASCYWLEGLTWVGAAWGDPSPPPEPGRPGESEAAALARALEPQLGRLTGARDGQAFRVARRHVGDVVVWLGQRTIDWSRPVTIEVDGRAAFSGRVVPDPALALARAAATMDFDDLKLAGVRVSVSGEATVLTAGTLPEPVWRTGR